MSPAANAATLTARRSTRFVAWVRAWRAGLVPFDDLADEITGGEEHLVADAPGTWTDVPLGAGLPVFAKLHPDDVRLVLPAPGDPRGLPGPGPLTGAAMLAGEALMTPSFGIVPEVRSHTSGSGVTFETVLWRVIATGELRDNLAWEGSIGWFVGEGRDLVGRFADSDFIYVRLKHYF